MEVIVRITGGLGNQMFQYATAYAVARRWNASLLLDDSGFDRIRSASRYYSLDVFKVSGHIVSRNPLARFIRHFGYRGRPVLWPVQLAVNLLFAKHVYKEPQPYQVDCRLWSLNATKRLNLDGYWQSPKYFVECERDLRSEFEFARPAEGENAKMLLRIRGTPNAVSIHLRRGDYLNVRPQAVLPLSYYRQGAELIAGRLGGEVHGFVFSDDARWARDNLNLPFGATIVDINGELAGHEDMRLMSACHHHIIANSSFSWWGAWLNPSPEKLVIAPRLWMGTPDSYYPDLYPPEWIVLD